MRLLFLGIDPSNDLKRVLLSQGFDVVTSKKPLPQENFDLVAYAPKQVAQISELTEIRKAHPATWLALIIEQKWLKDATTVNTILNHKEKNEVWISSLWESTFWFSIQSLLHHQKIRAELDHAEDRCHRLQKELESISRSSEGLIKKLERDVALASSIQRSILPKTAPEIPGASLAVKYIPAAGLGGDYYDIFEFGDKKRFGLLLADSKSHGMAAALLSVLLKVRLEEMKDRFPDSKTFVEHIDREIQLVQQKDLAALSLLYGILDRSSLTFQYTSAGPLRPLLWRLGEPVALTSAINPQIGGVDRFSFQENFIRLQPGDLLVFHTDGLEAPLEGKAAAAITEFLKKTNSQTDPREIQNEVMALIDRYVEKKELPDDVTVIHLSIHERTLYLAPTGS